ncbi:MAG: class I SAM-dependent methyltransferase, partial [bacterium]
MFKSNYRRQLDAMNPSARSESGYQSAHRYYSAELEPLLPRNVVHALDIGSGYGHLLRFLVDRGCELVSGVELDEALCVDAQARLGNLVNSLTCEDALSFLEHKSAKYDLITLFDVIEHFDLGDGLRLLKLAHESLIPGGIIVIRTPNMANIAGSYARYLDLTHCTGFTEQSLSELMSRTGFADPALHVPSWSSLTKRSLNQQINTGLHRLLFRLQDRS